MQACRTGVIVREHIHGVYLAAFVQTWAALSTMLRSRKIDAKKRRG